MTHEGEPFEIPDYLPDFREERTLSIPILSKYANREIGLLAEKYRITPITVIKKFFDIGLLNTTLGFEDRLILQNADFRTSYVSFTHEKYSPKPDEPGESEPLQRFGFVITGEININKLMETANRFHFGLDEMTERMMRMGIDIAHAEEEGQKIWVLQNDQLEQIHLFKNLNLQ